MDTNPSYVRGAIQRGRCCTQQEDLHRGGLGWSKLSLGRGIRCRYRRMETNREPTSTHDWRTMLFHQPTESEQRPQATETEELQKSPVPYYVRSVTYWTV